MNEFKFWQTISSIHVLYEVFDLWIFIHVFLEVCLDFRSRRIDSLWLLTQVKFNGDVLFGCLVFLFVAIAAECVTRCLFQAFSALSILMLLKTVKSHRGKALVIVVNLGVC